MNREAIKDVLKSMPIWDSHDKFRNSHALLQHKLDNYLERQDARGKVLEEGDSILKKLAEISNQRNKLPPVKQKNSNSNDDDVIGTYQRLAHQDQATKVEQKQKKIVTKEDYLRDDSVVMLEKKIKPGEEVYAMHEPGKPWVKCKVVCIVRKPIRHINKPLIIFRLKTCSNGDVTNRNIDVNKFSVARIQNHSTLLCVSKRVIAGFTNSRFFPGIIAQEPNPINHNRYLVLMDNGSAIYYKPHQIFPIFYQSAFPWMDIQQLENFDRNILAHLKKYFNEYPRRNLYFCEEKDEIKLHRNGTIVSAQVVEIDVDTMRLVYKDKTEESIHRGSPRLITSSDEKWKQLAMVNSVEKLNGNLLFAMAKYHKAGVRALDEDFYNCIEAIKSKVYVSGGNQTARKSTSILDKKIEIMLDDVIVDQINLHNPVELEAYHIDQSKRHKCNLSCLEVPGVRTESSVDDIIDEFRQVSDLKVPIILGWKRIFADVGQNSKNRTKNQIVYIAPCSKIFKQLHEIRKYISITKSKLDIDYFTLDKTITMNNPQKVKKIYYQQNIAIDKKTNRPLENKNISLLNCEDNERLPVDFEYNNKVVPHVELTKIGFTFNNDFKSSCDCEDDCMQRASCACHRLTEESAGKTAINRGMIDNTCQYTHKRLKDQVNTGIFECNSGCKCSSKCGNRVVQNGIRFRLQVMKMPGKKGWGVITKDDIPEGAFICTYSAELLDDADQYGNSDMYYADLDYITVNEVLKEGIEEEEDKNEDEGFQASDDEKSTTNDPKINNEPSCSNETSSNNNGFSKTTNKRAHDPSSSESSSDEEGSSGSDSSGSEIDVCEIPKKISLSGSSTSISSFELEKTYTPEKPKTRYPIRKTRTAFNNQAFNGYSNDVDKERPTQYKRLHTILKSRDFTLDARMQGNIGRFFNHSCSPNAYVQNVFIETHDLRFPVVAFFARKTIKATSEITWNYNYKTGSIEGRRIDCECGSAICKGRIL